MSSNFFAALRGEWMKQRRGLAIWMVLAGAAFTPAIMVAMRLLRYRIQSQMYAAPDFWLRAWDNAWESAAIFFLPMGAVLVTSLVVHVEFRNNTWKQVHVLPIHRATVFFSKLAIPVLLVMAFIALFNLAFWLSVAVPALLVPGLAMPQAAIPWRRFLGEDLGYLVGCLPIVALLYAIALRLRPVMAPIGIGFMAWVATLGSLSTHVGAFSPFAPIMLQYIGSGGARKVPHPPIDLHALALLYFVLFVAIGYAAFASARQKG